MNDEDALAVETFLSHDVVWETLNTTVLSE
jgi:hypothetical protein